MKVTFEDLSDEEKTKAFLQLLEYRLKVEKVRTAAKLGFRWCFLTFDKGSVEDSDQLVYLVLILVWHADIEEPFL